MEDKLKKFVQENKDKFERKEPSAEIFQKMMAQITPEPRRIQKRSTIWIWSAAAAVIFLLAIGFLWRTTEQNAIITAENADTNRLAPEIINKEDSLEENDAPAEAEKKSFQTEKYIAPKPVRNTYAKQKEHPKKRPVDKPIAESAVAMLRDEQSASKRMEGLLTLKKQDGLSKHDLSQVKDMMLHDPNSNIRHTAWEVLIQRVPEDEQENVMQEYFVAQSDLGLQMELMQLMNNMDTLTLKPTTAQRLQEIVEDPMTVDILKEQAYAVLINKL